MRALTYASFMLVAAGAIVSCGEDDDGGGSTSSGKGGSGSSMVSCPANPSPGDSCTANGTCSNATNCFCLSGSISCSDSPPPTGGTSGTNGTGGQTQGGTVDCGGDPSSGDDCNGQGECEGAPGCFCDGDTVQGFQCGDGGGFGGSFGGFDAQCGDSPDTGDTCTGGPGICEGTNNCVCDQNGMVTCG
jgi:hypothetical protein